MPTATLPRFVSAQPDEPWFVWQTHVYVRNFLDHGIDPSRITALFGSGPTAVPSPELHDLIARFPEVDIRVMADERDERGRAYPPSIQPHLIERWLGDRPERAGEPAFFHDCDIIFHRLPDFAQVRRDHPGSCVLSDARSYVGYAYLHECSEVVRSRRPGLAEDDLIDRMCSLVGLDPTEVRTRDADAGGGQYLLTGVGRDYWSKVYTDSLALRDLFDNYGAQHGLEHDYIQSWTAGMWAYLWNLWAADHDTVIHSEMAFAFSFQEVDDATPIIHMAGASAATKPCFDKGSWRERNPIEAVASRPYLFDLFAPDSASAAYAEAVRAASGVAHSNVDMGAARWWRLLALEAGPHGDIWDVEHVHFNFDSPVAVLQRFASGSAGEGFEAENAWRDDRTFWGGRVDAHDRVAPELFIGLELSEPAVPTAVAFTHAESHHRVEHVMLQSSVDGVRWSTVRIAAIPETVRHHVVSYRSAKTVRAQGWRLSAATTSSGWAWDLHRVRFLGDDVEQDGELSSSGDAGEPYSIDQVREPDDRCWGGRPDDDGRFHLTLHQAQGATVDRIVIDQGADHWASSVLVERVDGSGAWQPVRRFDELTPGRNEMLLFEEVPRPVRSAVSAEAEAARAEARLAAIAAAHAPPVDPEADRRIRVLIASYRDPEVSNTVASALTQAAYPELLRFSICHQYDDVTRAALDRWQDDPRFLIDAIPHEQSQGCCWARHRTFESYVDEPYILQIDAHTRFAARWDVRYINMLEAVESDLPVLTTYPPRFTVDDDGSVDYDLGVGVQRLVIKEFRDDLTTLQVTEPASETSPEPSPTLAAGQIFARGRFCRDVPYDPEMYFAGEEISLAARAYTHGYDLVHPPHNLIWHLYDHESPKHWDDHHDHAESHRAAVLRLERLFGGDDESLGRYGLGSARTLESFGRYSGLPLGAPAEDEDTVVITIDRAGIEPRDDYQAFVLTLLDDAGAEVDRRTVRAPDVLDLSRARVCLRGVDATRAVAVRLTTVTTSGIQLFETIQPL